MQRFYAVYWLLAGLTISVCLIGCGHQKSLMKVQNEVKQIESDWIDVHNENIVVHTSLVDTENTFVDAYNSAKDLEEKVLVLKNAIQELERLKGAGMGTDYQLAFNAYLNNIVSWKVGLETKDAEVIVHGAEQNVSLGQKLVSVVSAAQLTAAALAVDRVEALDLTDIPQDYQVALDVWKENIKSIEKSIRAKEFEVATEFLAKNVPLIEKVNVIAEKHGLIIER